jgi:hypothetical protein
MNLDEHASLGSHTVFLERAPRLWILRDRRKMFLRGCIPPVGIGLIKLAWHSSRQNDSDIELRLGRESRREGGRATVSRMRRPRRSAGHGAATHPSGTRPSKCYYYAIPPDCEALLLCFLWELGLDSSSVVSESICFVCFRPPNDHYGNVVATLLILF